jgi:uncharacterized protein (TIGR02246 family)
MTFRETLEKHLAAIRQRDFEALAETVAEDALVLITAEGRLVESAQEFLGMHRDWFAMDGWRLEATPVRLFEAPEMGVAVLRLEYREDPPDRPPVRQQSYLTLVFERRDGRWLMVQDQNTPVQKR